MESILGKEIIKYFSEKQEYKRKLATPNALRGFGELKYSNSDLAYMKNPPSEVEIKVYDIMKKSADEHAAKVAGWLYNCDEKEVEVLGRWEMKNGRTLPTKIKVSISPNVNKTFYVKKPCEERFLGKEVYNLCSNSPNINFVFNENSVAVDEVPGKLKSKFSKKGQRRLHMNEKYLENLIRLDVFVRTFAIDDIYRPVNTLVDKERNIYLFDFDKCFKRPDPRFGTGSYSLIDQIEDIEKKMPHLEEIKEDERNMIFRRVEQNKENITKLIDIMKKVNFNSEDAEFLGNYANMGEYIESQIESLTDNANNK